MSNHTCIAIDLGVDETVLTAGSLRQGMLTMHEIYRFPTRVRKAEGSVRWDLPLLADEIIHGLSLHEGQIDSIAVTGWGADYGLVDSSGEIIGLPYCYRDPRTVGKMEELFRRIPAEVIFTYTGNQPRPVNTLYQLEAHRQKHGEELERTAFILFIPDLINHLLTGKAQTEFTIATTSQMLHRETGTWCMPLVDSVMLPSDKPHGDVPLKIKRSVRNRLLQPVMAGSVAGKLRPRLAERTGLGEVPVMVVASNRLASAVAALPAEGADWVFLVSGNRMSLGLETSAPVLTEELFRDNFTNEGSLGGGNLLFKEAAGWDLLDGCRRSWYPDGTLTNDSLVEMAEASVPFTSFIDTGHYSFLQYDKLDEAIRGFCLRTGQDIPQSHGQVVRVLLESLVMGLRRDLAELQKHTKRRIERLHFTGRGAGNPLFCQMVADGCGIHVTALAEVPVAAGNLLCQALAAGVLQSPEDIRTVMIHSMPVKNYQPAAVAGLEKAYCRYLSYIR